MRWHHLSADGGFRLGELLYLELLNYSLVLLGDNSVELITLVLGDVNI